MKTPYSSSQSGFTILEMVIVLGIISTLMGAFLSFYQPTQTARNAVTTDQRIDRVMNALSSYALRYNYLPCPASPTATSNFGVRQANCSGGGAAWGLVPYVDLGLSQEDVQDGFGRFMTYVVARIATAPTGDFATDGTDTANAKGKSPSRFCISTDTLKSPNISSISASLITIRRPLPANIVEPNVVFAVISYGNEGFGAYNMEQVSASNRQYAIGSDTGANNGQLDQMLGNSSGERENAVDRAGSSSQNIYISQYNTQKTTNHFDDQVGYALGTGLISRLGSSCTP